MKRYTIKRLLFLDRGRIYKVTDEGGHDIYRIYEPPITAVINGFFKNIFYIGGRLTIENAYREKVGTIQLERGLLSRRFRIKIGNEEWKVIGDWKHCKMQIQGAEETHNIEGDLMGRHFKMEGNYGQYGVLNRQAMKLCETYELEILYDEIELLAIAQAIVVDYSYSN